MKRRIAASPVALTVAESAWQLGVSQMTIRRLLAHGALVRVKVGRSVRVLARSVDEFAQRGGVDRAT